MKKFLLPIECLKDKFEDFNLIKQIILPQLNPSKSPHPTISELDWDNSGDFNRPWVKDILPHLSYNLTKLIKRLNYSNILIENVWYQKYNTQSYHGWHIHSGHYTGVLYLEYPKETPPTQLIFNNEIISIDATEGDLIIFPSIVVHRSPINESQLQKTIISFNFRVGLDIENFPL